MTNWMYVLLWMVVAVVLAVIEGLTVQLVSIWFVIGAVPAMVAAALGGTFETQLIAFFVASVFALLFMKPIVKKRIETVKEATNADMVIGMTGIVLKDVDNIKEEGRVLANGLEWTARSYDSNVKIPKDSQVLVLDIEGVKLIVKPVE